MQFDGFVLSGSKRLPGKKPTETGPRRVKTYAERLQEMKSDQKFSTPVAPRSQYGSSSKLQLFHFTRIEITILRFH